MDMTVQSWTQEVCTQFSFLCTTQNSFHHVAFRHIYFLFSFPFFILFTYFIFRDKQKIYLMFLITIIWEGGDLKTSLI
jgi:hypothetical protein